MSTTVLTHGQKIARGIARAKEMAPTTSAVYRILPEKGARSPVFEVPWSDPACSGTVTSVTIHRLAKAGLAKASKKTVIHKSLYDI